MFNSISTPDFFCLYICI